MHSEQIRGFTTGEGLHVCKIVVDANRFFAYRANCSCGAQWRYAHGTSKNTMLEIYKSHLAYFTRPLTQTL